MSDIKSVILNQRDEVALRQGEMKLHLALHKLKMVLTRKIMIDHCDLKEQVWDKDE